MSEGVDMNNAEQLLKRIAFKFQGIAIDDLTVTEKQIAGILRLENYLQIIDCEGVSEYRVVHEDILG